MTTALWLLVLGVALVAVVIAAIWVFDTMFNVSDDDWY